MTGIRYFTHQVGVHAFPVYQKKGSQPMAIPAIVRAGNALRQSLGLCLPHH